MQGYHDLISYIKTSIKSGSFFELFWVALSQLVTIIFGFSTIKILSTLGSDQYGNYALTLTIAALLSMLIFGPLTQGFIRFYYNYAEKGIVKIYTKYIYSLIINISLLLLILSFFIIIGISLSVVNIDILFLLISAFFILSLKFDEFTNSHLNIIRKRKSNSIFQIIEKILIIVFLLLLFYNERLSLNNALAVFSIGYLLFFLIKVIYIKRFYTQIQVEEPTYELDKYKREIKKYLVSYTTPFIIWGISNWFQLNGEKWIIAKFLSTSDLGVYSVMITLINAFIVIPNNVFSEYALPIVFQRFSDLGNKKRVFDGLKIIRYLVIIIFMFLIFSAVITYYLGDYLIIFISSSSYTQYSYLLPFISIGTGLFFMGQAECLVGMSLNLPQKYLSAKISIGILSVIFNLIFIKMYGVNGAAISIVLVGIIFLTQVYLINRKIIKGINSQSHE